MKIGTMNAAVDRAEGDTRSEVELYDAAIERLKADEEAGFDYITVGEHHFLPSSWNPSPLMVLAKLAGVTSTLRLGTNVLLTPMYHPVRLAEDAATLDLLSHGRVDLICGSGSIRGEFETLGINADERFGRMWETMDILRRSYSEPQFDYNGKHFQFPNIRMTTQPVQKPFPIWYGGFGPKSVARAGKEGYSILTNLDSNWDDYISGLKANGHRIEDVNMGVMVHVAVCATQAEADEARSRALASATATANRYLREGRGTSLQNREGAREVNAGVVGTPDEVLQQLAPRLEDSSFTHYLYRGTGDKALFTKEIMPVLKKWGRQSVKTV